jgi:hypothetical protein
VDDPSSTIVNKEIINKLSSNCLDVTSSSAFGREKSSGHNARRNANKVVVLTEDYTKTLRHLRAANICVVSFRRNKSQCLPCSFFLELYEELSDCPGKFRKTASRGRRI